MKNLIIFILITHTSFLYAKLNIVTSIAPIKTFIQKISKDKANITVMVKVGSSPHTYEPKPSQMKDISKADFYFSIGVEFEKTWLPKFINQNEKMKIVDLSLGIIKMEMVEHHHNENKELEDKHHEDKDVHEHHGKLDPHIWTSPDNVKTIVKNILKYLIKIDSINEEYYKKNYESFLQSLKYTDNKIKDILSNTPRGTKFMVFHPSWGYFAKQYNLVQSSIEIEGKSPKPKELIKILNFAKKEHIKAIIASPEFSVKMANIIAKNLKIKVIKLSPLNPNWSNNLINLSMAIAK